LQASLVISIDGTFKTVGSSVITHKEYISNFGPKHLIITCELSLSLELENQIHFPFSDSDFRKCTKSFK